MRAVNQYRRRDVLTYLALRYYLANTASCTDHWARSTSVDLVLRRSRPVYFPSIHFKDVGARGAVEHRTVFLPGANEALAEAALLDACSARRDAFANPPCVFSYELSQGSDRRGMFDPYFLGLQRRHEAIAAACEEEPNGVVRYADIKHFYPSIKPELALAAWRKQAKRGKISPHECDLGEKLIDDHCRARDTKEGGILTGPMFSHLLGNLVLRDVDEACAENLPARYFRYVDDMTLVGDPSAVGVSLDFLRARLGELGFELHDEASPKSISVSTGEWLEGRNDFRPSRHPVSWMAVIGDLKQFLVQNPDQREALRSALLREGLRIPVRDYGGTIQEASYFGSFVKLATDLWFRRKVQKISIDSLVNRALKLRDTYEAEFHELMRNAARAHGFRRKRRIPKLRYRAARLVYLAAEDALASLASEAIELPELRFHAEVMSAVSSGRVEQLLPLGANAAQAAAQPLRASDRKATAIEVGDGKAEEQGLAIFALNGVPVAQESAGPARASELMTFATNGIDLSLMKSTNPFIQELACLHGLSEQPRHPELLNTAFDQDESLAMDAIDQVQQSGSI